MEGELMMIIGHQVGNDLCKALGLPRNTLGFTLRCYAGKLVTVECEYVPEGGIAAVLAQYGLVRKTDDGQPEQPTNYDTWLRERTERAHRDFMERTSRHLPCDRSTEEIARYFGAPIR